MTEVEARDNIVAAWLELPAEDRQIRHQAIAFAQVQARQPPFSGGVSENIRILSWLLPTLPRGKHSQAAQTEQGVRPDEAAALTA